MTAVISSMKSGCWIWSGDRLTAEAQAAESRQALPDHDLAGGLEEHRPAERVDRTVLLGQPDELGGIDLAASWMGPAGEGLEGHDPAGGERDDRLEVDREVAPADAKGQVRGQRVALDDGPVHQRIEDLDPTLAVRLGAVHRDVGVAQQPFDRLARAREADPGAATDDDVGPGQREGQPEGGHDALGQRQGVVRCRPGAGQDGELVATEAGQQVATRICVLRRSATAISRSSPAPWPSVSLTILKSSRSRNTIEVGVVGSTVSARRRSTARRTRAGWPARSASRGRPGGGEPP